MKPLAFMKNLVHIIKDRILKSWKSKIPMTVLSNTVYKQIFLSSGSQKTEMNAISFSNLQSLTTARFFISTAIFLPRLICSLARIWFAEKVPNTFLYKQPKFWPAEPQIFENQSNLELPSLKTEIISNLSLRASILSNFCLFQPIIA